MRRFLDQLLPAEPADVLIIAGDLSHYNAQSIFALRFFAAHFQHVFYCLGNHDYYLVSRNHMTRYEKNSTQRANELYDMTEALPNITRLHQYGVATFDGISFAGATNWYGLHSKEEQAFFNERSNDSKLIQRFSIGQQHALEMAAYEQLDSVDVLVTHVPPIYINSHLTERSTSCYLNQLKTVKAKHHVFGHCHEQEVYVQQANYYINALGYPDEKLPQKMRVFTV